MKCSLILVRGVLGVVENAERRSSTPLILLVSYQRPHHVNKAVSRGTVAVVLFPAQLMRDVVSLSGGLNCLFKSALRSLFESASAPTRRWHP